MTDYRSNTHSSSTKIHQAISVFHLSVLNDVFLCVTFCIVWLLSSSVVVVVVKSHHMLNCEFLFFVSLFFLSSFCPPPSFLSFKPANPASQPSFLPCWIYSLIQTQTHSAALPCEPAFLLHSWFLPFFLAPFSPPSLTRATMPSPGWHTVKLRRQPSATAAQISVTAPPLLR